ncbi:MAG TPA: thioesterase family protein, partial [Steroidobacteraceae bacterium]|nr:thioesterase family protein [Steroidobacteraceae bacterium]
GPCLKWPWTKLEAPELTERLIDRMVEGTSAQAAGRSIRELERLRDDYLVAIQQVLRQFDIGAGSTLRSLEARLYNDAKARHSGEPEDPRQPLKLVATQVRPDWIDYNGHMTDYRYLQVFGDAVDALLRRVGIDEHYRAKGRSPYTVETHVTYLAELRQGDSLYVTTQVLAVDPKRLQLFHRLCRADGTLAATAEHMFVHVDVTTGKSAPMAPEAFAKLAEIGAAHAGLPRPAEAGRAIGMRR